MIHSTHRFHGRNSLRFVYQHGRQVRGEMLSLRATRNGRQEVWRAAVVVSRKVSKSAVVRNRIRRRVFEILRTVASRIDGPYDLVFTVYAEGVATLSTDDLRRTILDQLEKAAVLKASASAPDHAIVIDKETL
ncbi:MAG TPA: ribonuclease P protein component [Patescibacteria group bacterium]|nr:ribonuclease P protein component [Patescibacteria group bacterium]